MRLAFMGTPDFAVPSLEILYRSKHEVVMVVTAPDKPRGRGRKVTSSPVKQAAISMNLPISQPTNLKDATFVELLGSHKPDIIVVVAFRILPEVVFNLPPRGSINLHASLLPDYRGAAPINWALINGEEKTGLTTFFLKQKVDTGDILLQQEVPIDSEDDFGRLHDKLKDEGARLLLKTIDMLEDGELKPRRQKMFSDKSAPKITPQTGLIAWDKAATQLQNLIRGLAPVPGAYSYYGITKMIILKASVVSGQAKAFPGTVIESGPRAGLTIACGQGALAVDLIKPEGKKTMKATEYLRGHDVKVGTKFDCQRQAV
jgi:methionyl-tRNA formyltransferase